MPADAARGLGAIDDREEFLGRCGAEGLQVGRQCHPAGKGSPNFAGGTGFAELDSITLLPS